jgi:hypothetical protein
MHILSPGMGRYSGFYPWRIDVALKRAYKNADYLANIVTSPKVAIGPAYMLLCLGIF